MQRMDKMITILLVFLVIIVLSLTVMIVFDGNTYKTQ